MKKPILIIISILFTLNTALGIKPGGKKEWLDYEDAKKDDPDFSILGEYGSAKDGGAKWVEFTFRPLSLATKIMSLAVPEKP